MFPWGFLPASAIYCDDYCLKLLKQEANFSDRKSKWALTELCGTRTCNEDPRSPRRSFAPLPQISMSALTQPECWPGQRWACCSICSFIINNLHVCFEDQRLSVAGNKREFGWESWQLCTLWLGAECENPGVFPGECRNPTHSAEESTGPVVESVMWWGLWDWFQCFYRGSSSSVTPWDPIGVSDWHRKEQGPICQWFPKTIA